MKPLKIYFDHFPLIISDHDIPEFRLADTLQLEKKKTAIATLKKRKGNAKRAFIKVKKYPKALKKIFREYKMVIAGGGLVRNQNGDILLIYRKGFWDMAKGHLETGETIEECAIREVKEETGIKNINSVRELGITYHTYFRSKNILKENHWYLMEGISSDDLKPQREEGVDIVKWVPINEIESYYDKMFPSIRDIIRQFVNEIAVLTEA